MILRCTKVLTQLPAPNVSIPGIEHDQAISWIYSVSGKPKMLATREAFAYAKRRSARHMHMTNNKRSNTPTCQHKMSVRPELCADIENLLHARARIFRQCKKLHSFEWDYIQESLHGAYSMPQARLLRQESLHWAKSFQCSVKKMLQRGDKICTNLNTLMREGRPQEFILTPRRRLAYASVQAGGLLSEAQSILTQVRECCKPSEEGKRSVCKTMYKNLHGNILGLLTRVRVSIVRWTLASVAQDGDGGDTER
jgi:hypothetical protein